MVKEIMLIIGGAIAYFGGILFGAFVLLKIWGWYLVPGFNAPELTMATAVGVKLIANSLTSIGSNKSDYGFIELVCLGYLSNVCLLAIAYILLLFV